MDRRLALLTASLICCGCAFADEIPIDAIGWNQDLIVEAGGTFPGSVNGTMDGGPGATTGNTWYGVGFNATDPTTGLPTGPITSTANPTSTFQLQPFTQNNALMLVAGDGGGTTGTLTFLDPLEYSTISVFGSSANGASTIDYTINFANGSTQTGSFFFDDWFDGDPTAFVANGRVNEGGFDAVNSGNPRIYQQSLTFTDPGFAVTSVDFAYDLSTEASGGNAAILAISGAVAPEPASIGLIAAGGLALLLVRKRS